VPFGAPQGAALALAHCQRIGLAAALPRSSNARSWCAVGAVAEWVLVCSGHECGAVAATPGPAAAQATSTC